MPDKLLSFNDEGVQFAWDATSLSNFMKCPRYYQLVNLEGWQPRQKSVHLLFGGWFASAIENYHKHRHAGASHDEATLAQTQWLLEETWDEDKWDGAWISGHDTKTRETLVRSFVWYVEHYLTLDEEVFPITLVGDEQRPALELSFTMDLGDDILWCGHMDRVVSPGEGTYVMDQKTTGGAISSYFFKGFLLDPQMSGYTLAGKTLYHLPLKGVIIDAIEIKVGFTRFGRGFVNRSESQLEEFVEVAKSYIADAQRMTADGNFRPNFASCGNYGGCAFREVCTKSPEHRENFLRADFTRQPRWDPLERR